jgi:hypothetical protein
MSVLDAVAGVANVALGILVVLRAREAASRGVGQMGLSAFQYTAFCLVGGVGGVLIGIVLLFQAVGIIDPLR